MPIIDPEAQTPEGDLADAFVSMLSDQLGYLDGTFWRKVDGTWRPFAGHKDTRWLRDQIEHFAAGYEGDQSDRLYRKVSSYHGFYEIRRWIAAMFEYMYATEQLTPPTQAAAD